MNEKKAALFTGATLGWNLAYGIFNGVLGAVYRSAWFYVMAANYVLLGIMRLYAVTCKKDKPESGAAARVTGAGMLLLAIVMSLTVMLTIRDSVGRRYNKTVMIAIATITFFIVIRAIVYAVKAHRRRDAYDVIVRNIACAASVGSILSLERSMLGTFGQSTDRFTYVVEGCSGLAGFLIIAALGVSMMIKKKKM